ncbi:MULTISPECIES: acyl carrier protein [Nonomuraea]|uniref:acyl carrier protein n=1 Tax=Nonomuraea TaxID=83681 RepID=UPI001CD9C2B5|nr:acyl carrier protein [Nonomuraea aurantiaca]MCA2227856.1 acyl carrier protein [Nonomuraea aurantiaca]
MGDYTAETINDFIHGRFPDAAFTNDDDIFSLGFINSLFAMELVMYIEQKFSVTIPNDELKFDNFRTVNCMAELVHRQALPAVGQ